MAVRLDHITVTAPDLRTGAVYVESALGVSPGPGREHPGMGTHNLLLAVGPAMYLEVIAPDPSADPVRRTRWFGLDHVNAASPARLAAWVASTDDIAGATVPELGTVETMWRGSRRWQMTVREDGSVPMGGAAPLLIQRAPDANPLAGLLDHGLRLCRLHIHHPLPTHVTELLKRIGLESSLISVRPGDQCRLVAEVQTAAGLRALGDA